MVYLKTLTFSVLLPLFFFFFSSSFVFAAGEPATLGDLNGVFKGLVSVVAIVGGMLAFLALIFGGFKYIMARGDPKATEGARGTLAWAILGLAFIIIAWLTLQFIKAFTGVDVTRFDINPPLSP